MQYYAAPMEGLTDRVWRQAQQKWFGPEGTAHRYYAPFLSPPENRVLIKKKMAELAPAANPGAPVIPQLLAKDGELAAWMIGELRALGYTEVNLNLGCPSGTVTAKGKGSGLLADVPALERLLDGVFARSPLPVSIKTRIGYTRPDEFDRLLDVFARYPIHELIIHPRTRVEFYKGTPHREAFAKAHAALDRPLCYNGDLFCEADCRELMRQFPNTRALMLGRGLIANPALAQSLGGGEALCKASLRAFHDRLLAAYQAKYPAHVTLGRMREIAKHFVCCFDAPEKPRKAIRKATRIEAYLDAIDRLFAEHELNENPRFIAE